MFSVSHAWSTEQPSQVFKKLDPKNDIPRLFEAGKLDTTASPEFKCL